jgi:predicted Zn-dependent peptidase
MSTPASFRKERLANGMVVLTERIPHVKSVAVGWWVRVGSREEPAPRAGISHFIEHLLFKGTARRSAEEIAKAIDAVGGTLDAFTSRESTCFYAKVLGDHLPLAVDLITDLVLHARLDPADIERERQVILQEIKMVEDDPGDLVHDLLAAALWGDHPLGRPVLGTRETLETIGEVEVRAHLRDFYQPDRVIVAAAGDVEHGRLVDLLAEATRGWDGRALPVNSSTPAGRAAVVRDGRDSAQVHLCLGVEGLQYAHRDRYALYLLNAILGSSMSSRLFQEVREKRGLAYSIYSYQQSYRDTGLLVVYAGTAPASYRQVLDLVQREWRRLRNEPPDPDEFRRAKEQLKGNLLLGLESTNNRMTRLAKMEFYFGRTFDLDEIIRGIEAATPESFQDLAQRLFGRDAYALTTIGPVPEPAAVA